MRPDPCWPQWLSVPAAPDWTLAAPVCKPRARLFRMVADHGLARARPAGAGSGQVPGVSGLAASAEVGLLRCMELGQQLAPRVDQSSVSNGVWHGMHHECVARFQEDRGLPDRCGLGSLSLLDLGRHDAARVEPAAQRFDLGPGTLDSRRSAAMDAHQLDLALSAGRHAVERAKLDGVALIWAQGQGAGAITTNQVWRQRFRHWPQAFIPDDPASTSAFNKGLHRHRKRSEPYPGTEAKGADADLALERHAMALSDPYEALRCLGGFEHAALVGSALAAAQLGLRWQAVGESADIAMQLALCLNPSVEPWLRAESWLSSCGCDSGRLGADSCLQ